MREEINNLIETALLLERHVSTSLDHRPELRRAAADLYIAAQTVRISQFMEDKRQKIR